MENIQIKKETIKLLNLDKISIKNKIIIGVSFLSIIILSLYMMSIIKFIKLIQIL